VHGDDRRLSKDDALALYIYESVRGAKIDGQIVREKTQNGIKDHVRSNPVGRMKLFRWKTAKLLTPRA
jgi:hypothetical protein